MCRGRSGPKAVERQRDVPMGHGRSSPAHISAQRLAGDGGDAVRGSGGGGFLFWLYLFLLGRRFGCPLSFGGGSFRVVGLVTLFARAGIGESRARLGDVELTNEAAVTISKGLVDEGKCVSSGTGRPVSASRARTA